MKIRRILALACAATLGPGALALGIAYHQTESGISAHHDRVRADSLTAKAPPPLEGLEALPTPVQRYLRYAFPQGVPAATHVEMQMQGNFRRPGTESFAPTSASQTAATRTPAMAFDATTPIVPGIWARAYDAYANGQMEMKARILSAITVVDEHSSPELNRISLRRWLLESPTYPQALLPGGVVRWEPVDDRTARAVATDRGMTTSLLARFGDDGRLASFQAEEDGDLTTPYHGSGEHVARSDYRLVQGIRVPMGFTISRMAKGRIMPFWEGRITSIRFALPS
ncbi:MAG: DUF6544 family protein [Burkholderiaceae bacterium]